MKITDFLSEDLMVIDMKPADKNQTCAIMVDHLIKTGRLPADRRDILLDKILEREALSSTGIGGGVAIPHASGENLDNMVVVMGQIPEGVEFGAIDGEPAHLIFMIVGSDRAPRVHLQLLAVIVRVCKNRELVAKLIEAGTSAEAWGLITDFDGG